MRTTITLPDDLAREAQQLLDDRSFSDFARESIALRVSQLKHERLALEMKKGYEAEVEDPSLDPAWTAIEVEDW